jgi:hypothetical protein
MRLTKISPGVTIVRHQRRISTLDANRLSRRDLLDLSGRVARTLRITGVEAVGSLKFRVSHKKSIPFPAHARGFLYFRPGPEHAPLAGEIRFRCVPTSLPEDFATGTDLYMDYDPTIPWFISLHAALKSRTMYTGIAISLLRDNLVSESLKSQAAMWKTRHSLKHPMIHSLDQHFVVDFQQRSVSLNIGTEKRLLRLDFRMPIDERGSSNVLPWRGKTSLPKCMRDSDLGL